MRRVASCAQLLLRSGFRRLVIDSLFRIVVLCECAACHSLPRNICASLTKKKVIQQCQHVPAIIITTPVCVCVCVVGVPSVDTPSLSTECIQLRYTSRDVLTQHTPSVVCVCPSQIYGHPQDDTAIMICIVNSLLGKGFPKDTETYRVRQTERGSVASVHQRANDPSHASFLD